MAADAKVSVAIIFSLDAEGDQDDILAGLLGKQLLQRSDLCQSFSVFAQGGILHRAVGNQGFTNSLGISLDFERGFAVIGIVLLIIAQFAFFASAPSDANVLILIFIPAISRCCSALAVTGLKPMSTGQYADQKKPKTHMVFLTVMLCIFLGADFLLCGQYDFSLIGCLAGYCLALRRAYKSLRGMNGVIAAAAM